MTTCASRGCVAVVDAAGDTCPVHQRAQQGPYASPCEGCGKPITATDLWVRGRHPDRPYDGAAWPWHYACRPGAPAPVLKAKRAKRNWDSGLGLFDDGGAR